MATCKETESENEELRAEAEDLKKDLEEEVSHLRTCRACLFIVTLSLHAV